MLTYNKKINVDMRASYDINALGVNARIFRLKIHELPHY